MSKACLKLIKVLLTISSSSIRINDSLPFGFIVFHRLGAVLPFLAAPFTWGFGLFDGGRMCFGRPLKNHAPDRFHISRVSEQILHSQRFSFPFPADTSTPHFEHTPWKKKRLNFALWFNRMWWIL